MPSRAYADRTKVTEARSRADIEDQLEQHDCDDIGTLRNDDSIGFVFSKNNRLYRIKLAMPPRSGPNANLAERRRRMRTLFMYIKARLHAVRDDIKTFEEEFMPETVLGDGRTVAEHNSEQLKRIAASGDMPKRLLLPGATE